MSQMWNNFVVYVKTFHRSEHYFYKYPQGLLTLICKYIKKYVIKSEKGENLDENRSLFIKYYDFFYTYRSTWEAPVQISRVRVGFHICNIWFVTTLFTCSNFFNYNLGVHRKSTRVVLIIQKHTIVIRLQLRQQ